MERKLENISKIGKWNKIHEIFERLINGNKNFKNWKVGKWKQNQKIFENLISGNQTGKYWKDC